LIRVVKLRLRMVGRIRSVFPPMRSAMAKTMIVMGVLMKAALQRVNAVSLMRREALLFVRMV
jgi:hypothetical protein